MFVCLSVCLLVCLLACLFVVVFFLCHQKNDFFTKSPWVMVIAFPLLWCFETPFTSGSSEQNVRSVLNAVLLELFFVFTGSAKLYGCFRK